MTHITKVFIVIILGFALKLLFGCVPNSSYDIEIDYNYISVTAIDNSDKYLNYYNYNTADTMYSDAVALKLTLADTSRFYSPSIIGQLVQSFSFQSVHATSIDESYIPQNKVVDIKVKTLFDINEFLKAGDDVTDYFLCSTSDNFSLYYSLNQANGWLNSVQSNPHSYPVFLVLKPSLENTLSQFEIKVIFDDGSELTTTTLQFTIIQS